MWLIDIFSRTPIYEQIISSVESDVLNGSVKTGDRLPSLRELSVGLGINPNTIQKAFNELIHREIIQSAPGMGYFIAPEALAAVRARHAGALTDLHDLCIKLRLAGITEEAIVQTVRTVYAAADSEEEK